MKKGILFLSILTSMQVLAAIQSGSQIVNLNLSFKAKHKSVKSNLAMPFYQTAELEKTIDNKDYYFEINPKKGKNSEEIELDVRLFNKDKSKSIAHKEITIKINEEAKVSMKGVTIKIRPENMNLF